ncbi:MAG: hypothetical protein KDK97_03840 [Verrucomicrobiales bacterium]|nr:hypothetical protein [Verrucomicrobiales bacterium]MCP5559603.1 hypothetical protein [Verrucomicrobiaceae bacterium]
MERIAVSILIAVFTSLTAAATPYQIAAEWVGCWGQEGTAPGEFHIPIGIAISDEDRIFVTDHYNNRVQSFDGEGRLLSHFPVLPNPGGIAVHEDRLYIAHFPSASTPDRVSVYSLEGTFIREWGSSGAGKGQLDFAGGLAISAGGEVFVADQTNRRVQVFDLEGKFLRMWGAYGIVPGQFGGNVSTKSRVGGPQFVAIDHTGGIFTTEASVGRIQEFTAEGKPVLAWGDLADRSGSFGGKFAAMKANLVGPIGICVDNEDRLWVTAVSGRVQCFTRAGRYLGGLGDAQGNGPGEFSAPHGIAINSKNELFIIDTYNHRVQKYRITLPRANP